MERDVAQKIDDISVLK